MKKSIIRIFSMTAAILALTVAVCNGQTKIKCKPMPADYPFPHMWFTKEESQARLEDFWKIKRQVLKFNTGVYQKDEMKLGNFIGLLAYLHPTTGYEKLRVYIGMYDTVGIPGLPGYENQMTLIFARQNADSNDLDTDTYYIIPPEKPFDPANINDFIIHASEKEKLEKNYLEKMALSTIDPDNKDNMCDYCTIVKLSDTRSLLYDKKDLKQLIDEIGYCHKDMTTSLPVELSNDVVFFFTAINYRPDTQPNYRLSLQFEFTDTAGRMIALEDTYGFSRTTGARIDTIKNKKKVKPANWTLEISKLSKKVDNGQLCPTYCPR